MPLFYERPFDLAYQGTHKQNLLFNDYFKGDCIESALLYILLLDPLIN